MARHQNEFSPSLCRNTIKRCDKSVYLHLASIELFRDQQPIRRIARADGEGVNLQVRFPRCQARAQIRLETSRGLKPILRRLREQLQDDGLDGAGNPVGPLAWRSWWPGDVAMYPFHRIGCGERKRPRDRLVKGDAAGIEIAARINQPCGRSAPALCKRAFPRLLRSIPAPGARAGRETRCRNPSARSSRSRC